LEKSKKELQVDEAQLREFEKAMNEYDNHVVNDCDNPFVDSDGPTDTREGSN